MRDDLGRMTGSFTHVEENHLVVSDLPHSTMSHDVLVGVLLDVPQ